MPRLNFGIKHAMLQGEVSGILHPNLFAAENKETAGQVEFNYYVISVEPLAPGPLAKVFLKGFPSKL